jgi:hypothetical protein
MRLFHASTASRSASLRARRIDPGGGRAGDVNGLARFGAHAREDALGHDGQASRYRLQWMTRRAQRRRRGTLAPVGLLCTKCRSQTHRLRCSLWSHSGSCVCVNGVEKARQRVPSRHVEADRRHQKMANRAVLTVAAICTSTLAARSPNAGLRRVRSIRCGSRKPQQPNRLRRSARRLPAIAFISPRTSIGIGHVSDETSVRAVQPPSARLLDHDLEPPSRRQWSRVGPPPTASSPTSIRSSSSPRIAALNFARLQSSRTAPRPASRRSAEAATLFVGAQARRINDRCSDRLAQLPDEAVGAVDLIREFRVGHHGSSSSGPRRVESCLAQRIHFVSCVTANRCAPSQHCGGVSWR